MIHKEVHGFPGVDPISFYSITTIIYYLLEVGGITYVISNLTSMNRNILFAPDYVINAGGLINVANEIEGYDEAQGKTDTETYTVDNTS